MKAKGIEVEAFWLLWLCLWSSCAVGFVWISVAKKNSKMLEHSQFSAHFGTKNPEQSRGIAETTSALINGRRDLRLSCSPIDEQIDAMLLSSYCTVRVTKEK